MTDRAFSGKDVEEALASAGATLGLPVRSLRYVVLDPGSPGRVGAKPTPARIAVLIDRPAGPGGRNEPKEAASREAADDDEGDLDTAGAIRDVVGALTEAAGLQVEVEVREGREAVTASLHGPDREFFFGADGRGEVLRALEHLLQRMFGPEVAPLPVRVECEGFREHRDAALAGEARALAEEVVREGEARTLPPLNAYERRIVHVALGGFPGVATYSVGEGADRRVTIAPAAAAGAPGDEEPRG